MGASLAHAFESNFPLKGKDGPHTIHKDGNIEAPIEQIEASVPNAALCNEAIEHKLSSLRVSMEHVHNR